MKPPKDMTDEELEVNINTERPYADQQRATFNLEQQEMQSCH